MLFHCETDERLFLGEKPLTYTLYRAETAVSKAVGVMGRRGVPADTALAFSFDRSRNRPVHMVGVRKPIRVWWISGGRIERTALLRPWWGFARASADIVLELPADAPPGAVGERVSIRD